MTQRLISIFRPPLVFILLAVLGLTTFVSVLLIDANRKAERDLIRQADINSYYLALSQFKNDFGFYPNYSMVLGSGEEGEKNYDLVEEILLCPDHEYFVIKAEEGEDELGMGLLKPGYRSVGMFLRCLGYLNSVEQDPLWAGTLLDYQYRVSHNYSRAVVVARAELRIEQVNQETLVSQWPSYVAGDLSSRDLLDDSDSAPSMGEQYFQALVDRPIRNGAYLYQCLVSSEGGLLSAKERSSSRYAPFIFSNNKWMANPNCKDSLESLLIVASR